MIYKSVETNNLPMRAAAILLESLNPKWVSVNYRGKTCIVTSITSSVSPERLTFPKGWYVAKGNFRNKHQSTSGIYEEVPILDVNGNPWKTTVLP